jgi:hypothetical protein
MAITLQRLGVAAPNQILATEACDAGGGQFPVFLVLLRIRDVDLGVNVSLRRPFSPSVPYGVRTFEVFILSPSPAMTLVGTAAPVFM